MPSVNTFDQCPNGFFKDIVVNTNTDIVNPNDGRTSLREALIQTQQQPGCWNIVFKDVPKSDIDAHANGPSDGVNLGYWTIKLNDSLPALEEGNIKINYDFQKTVSLIPASFDEADKQRSFQLKPNIGNRGSGSLVNVGDMNIVNLEANNVAANTVKMPSVSINNFNFLNNRARGGDGLKYGGGGFGAGGGISLFSGSLQIENSVFQNLSAFGGRTSLNQTAPRPGKPASVSYDTVTQATNGQSGGVGGLFSAGIGKPGAGGAGGAAGGSYSDRRGISDSMFTGKNGGDGGKGQYGSGGGAGGGGGGGGMYYYDMSKYDGEVDRAIQKSDDHNKEKSQKRIIEGEDGNGNGQPLRYYPGTRYRSGTNGNYGDGGAFAGSGGRFNLKGKGGKGKGMAIAVHDMNIEGSKKNATLYLHNINFVNNYNGSYGRGFAGPSPDIWVSGNENEVYMSDVGFALTTQDKIKRPDDLDSEAYKYFIEINENNLHGIDDNLYSSVHYGYSAPTNDFVRRNPEWSNIQLTDGISDSAIVRFETAGSGTITNYADQTNLIQSINDIWSEILPDRSEEIDKKYQSDIVQALTNGQISLAEGLSDVYKLANIASFNPISSAGFSLLSSALTTAWSVYTADKEREEALRENEKSLEKLQNKIKANRGITFAPIQTIQNRNTVFIKDFQIGEDTILFQNMPNGGITYKSGSDPDPFIDIFAERKTSDNSAKRLARIYLSEASENMLGENDSARVTKLQSLAKNTGNEGEILLDRYSKPITLTTETDYNSGYESMLIRVKRSYEDTFDETFKVKTQTGDDQIYGSNGNEQILTRPGNDIVRPMLGMDTVDGGDGIDAVLFDHFPVQINSTSEEGSRFKVTRRDYHSHFNNLSNDSSSEDPFSDISYNTSLPIKSARVTPDGQRVEIEFAEEISQNLPLANHFEITHGGSPISINSISASENILSLNLKTSIKTTDQKEFYLTYLEQSSSDDSNSIQNTQGEDRKHFSLSNNPETNEWSKNGALTRHKLNSYLNNFEIIQVRGKSTVNLQNATMSDKSFPISGYEVITGGGSKIISSNFDDIITVSLKENSHLSTSDHSCTSTFINGGDGEDILRLELPEGTIVKHDKERNTAKGTIHYTNSENKEIIVSYKNIETVRLDSPNVIIKEEDFVQDWKVVSTEFCSTVLV